MGKTRAQMQHSLSIFFFRTFLQQHVLGPVPVLAADYGLSGPGWEAAVDGCLQPARVSQELVQSGRVTELCGCRNVEQRSRESSLRGNGEDATPTVHPSGLSSAAHGDRCAGSAGLREKSEEGRGFLTPAPSSFNTENDKAAAASTKQLRIGVPALALRRAGQSNARLRIGSGLRLALARERGDKCRIDGELSSVPEGQAIAHDLDPSGVLFVRRIFYDCAKESGPPRNCKLRTQVARGGGDCVVQYVARVLCKATLSRHHQRRSQPWLATLSRAAGARWARSRTSCATRRSDSVLQRLRKDAEALGAPIAAARGTLCAYSNHGTVTRCGRRLRPPIPCQRHEASRAG